MTSHDSVNLQKQTAVFLNRSYVSSADPFNFFQVAYGLVHRRQHHCSVGISRGYNRVSFLNTVRKGFAHAVHAGVLVGNDNGLNSVVFQLLAHDHQVGGRISEALL